MTEEAVDLALRVGDLLIRADVASVEMIEDAVALAGKMHQPLGRVMEMQGSMSEYSFECAMHIQAQIENGSLSLDNGVKALALVVKQNIELETALRKVSAPRARVQKDQANALGSLLLAAGFVTGKQLEEAMNQALNTGLPLGMVLVSLNSLSIENLQRAIQGLALLKELGMDKDVVLQVSRVARLRASSIRRSLEMHHLDPACMERLFGLAELLRAAGFITHMQAMSAREFSLVGDRPVDEVIAECAYTNEIGLAAAGHLMQMIEEEALSHEQAASILKRLKGATSSEEMMEVLSNLDEEDEVTEKSLEIIDLLKLSGLLTDAEIETATPIALSSRTPLVKTLLETQVVSPQTISLANEFKDHLDAGIIGVEQGVIAITYALENSMKFAAAVNAFGWS